MRDTFTLLFIVLKYVDDLHDVMKTYPEKLTQTKRKTSPKLTF